MTARDWDKELAKIDKHMASVSDDQLLERKASGTPQGARSADVNAPASGGALPAKWGGTSWGVLLRASLAVAVAVGVPFWPYASSCGFWLAGYLATITVMLTAGAWAALAAWRARMGRAHVVALLVIAWGASLAAREVLPRIGYAKDLARVHWTCQ